MRILAAGVGNALKGDDGFGVVAVDALARDARLPSAVTAMEFGIGGIHLVQELMRGYDAVILFDVVDRGAEPGRLFLLEPELPEVEALSERARRDFFADVHYATPIRAMTLASAVGALPALVRIVGCQCSDADALETGAFAIEMHERVAGAVEGAVEMALELAAQLIEDGARGG